MKLQATALTTEMLVSEQRGLPLVILSSVRKVRAESAQTLAWLLAPDGDNPGDGKRARETGCAAITWLRRGDGHAICFAFGLPRMMWLLHQGRPINADHDDDGYLRSMDAQLIASNDHTVTCTHCCRPPSG
jgi:hypothetical protein